MNNIAQMPKILNTDEVQEVLKIGKSSMYNLLASGKLKSFKIGRTWKVSLESLNEYLERNSK